MMPSKSKGGVAAVQEQEHGRPAVSQRVVVVLLQLLLMIHYGGIGVLVDGQQEYVNNHQLDCYNGAFNSTTKGYVCNGGTLFRSSCQSYLTFRSSPPYYTPATIAYLLGQDSTSVVSLIASINNISSDIASIPADQLVIIPINCSCYRSSSNSSLVYYQHNATYILKQASETYFSVANNTYQGLTTCQALMDQNPFGDRNLSVGLHLQIPLRCACPTSNQTAAGTKYLLTYMVTWGDSISSIADLFSVDQQSVLDANLLSSNSIIFPFTPILVPLTREPTMIRLRPTTVAAPPPQIALDDGNNSVKDNNTKKKWVFVGVGIGAAFLVVFAVSATLLLYRYCRRRPPQTQIQSSSSSSSKPAEPLEKMNNKSRSEDSYYDTYSGDTKSWSVSSTQFRSAVESLTIYRYEDLRTATDYFSQSNRIQGTSVYRGSFKGDGAAIKVIKDDVSGEINILKKINHSNIIRLSGFCLHEGNSYLVYEYADNGSLSDWLHSNSKHQHQPLAWKQRVQIAHDVADALNYLHNYANPPYIHKNLKSSNIFLDANLRAKIGNFGMARVLLLPETTSDHQEDEGGLQITRHVVGTKGYMAPEYMENGLITPKLDVFAFGVVILELLSGKEAVVVGAGSIRDNDNNTAAAADGGEGNSLLSALIGQVLEGENVRHELRGFLDPSLKDDYPLDLAFSLAQLARTCVAHDLSTRPSMPQVFLTLSKILSSSLDWDPSDEVGRSSSVIHDIGR